MYLRYFGRGAEIPCGVKNMVSNALCSTAPLVWVLRRRSFYYDEGCSFTGLIHRNLQFNIDRYQRLCRQKEFAARHY